MRKLSQREIKKRQAAAARLHGIWKDATPCGVCGELACECNIDGVVEKLVDMLDCSACPFRQGTHGIHACCTMDRAECMAKLVGHISGQQPGPLPVSGRAWQ